MDKVYSKYLIFTLFNITTSARTQAHQLLLNYSGLFY